MKNYSGLVIFLLLSLLFTSRILAHATGFSLEQQVDDHFIDIGISEPILYADETSRYDFELYSDQNRNETVEFTDVWVRIVGENGTAFASNLHEPSLGKTGMTFALSEAGDYSLEVRYHNLDETLAEHSFNFRVEKSEDENALITYASFGLGGVIVIALSFLAGFMLNIHLQKKSD